MGVVLLLVLATVVGLLVLYFLFWPVSPKPVGKIVAPNPPPLAGVYEENKRLQAVERLGDGHCLEPESIAFDSMGRIYSGMANGRIMRFDANGNKAELFVNTGEALKRNGKRNQIVLATKVHGQMADDDPNAWGNSRRHIIEQCEASLQRLQTDYIDLYQIHRPQPHIPIDETLRALDDLIRAGKVRYIGSSTFAGWQLVESLWVSKELGLNRFICEQPPYNILDRRIERELLPMAQTYGFAIIPWSPLAGGLLTGKYRRDQPLPEEGRYTVSMSDWPPLRRRFESNFYDIVDGFNR